MATQNSTITVKGKLGNIVGYKGRNGKRLARIRQTEVKNPKTDGQIIQRMILSTAAKAYGRMKSICDHSWQGIAYGGNSQSYFLKKAMERIRKFVADAIATMPASITDPLQWVGLARPNSLAEAGYGLQISEGTIPSVSATYAQVGEGEDKDTVLSHFGSVIKLTAEETLTIQNVMNSLGCKVGDQITAICITANGEFKYGRYVINNNATAAQLAADWDGSAEADAFDQEKSLADDVQITLSKLSTETERKLYVSTAKNEVIAAAAIVISRIESGTWQRSTQYLMPVSDVDYVDTIIKLWQLGTPEIATENPYYLNNADL